MFRRYAIKLNRKLTDVSCAICGQAVEAEIGPQLFLIDNWEIVCRRCGKEEAPLLVTLLELAQAAQDYVIVILESADSFTAEDLE